MKIIILIFIFFLTLFKIETEASNKEIIISKFEKIENLSFNFTQTINGKDEKGECIIEFPSKIYCKYKLRYKKELISNGKSLVIKSEKNNQYYIYPLKKTPLAMLLNKKFILNKLNNSEEKLLNNKYYLFSISENDQILNIFFDKMTNDLIGWQTEDIYQNLSVTFIFNLKINKNVNRKLFNLPLMN